MKKLSIISNQIKNNTYSYTGKGSFEAIVNKHKDKVLSWLEDLIPLQRQIEMLADLEDINFQKRNYTRILTKIFPEEYKEFVCVNILVRDANVIAQYYDDEYNVTILYDNLLKDKYLKYPGKYDKYVEFNIFQKFIMTYREDLMKSLETQNQTTTTKPLPKIDEEKEELHLTQPSLIEEEEPVKEESKKETKSKKKSKKDDEYQEESSKADKKDTNWTQLLLGKIK